MIEFTFYPGLNSFGFDLCQVHNKSVEELKEIAIKNDRCVAFNTLGFLKYFINDESAFVKMDVGGSSLPIANHDEDGKNNIGLYVNHLRLANMRRKNKNKSFLNFQDYVFFPNKDSAGNDIAAYIDRSIEELKEIADNDSRCEGFNTIGFIKNHIINENQFITIRLELYSEGLYVKVSKIKGKHVTACITGVRVRQL